MDNSFVEFMSPNGGNVIPKGVRSTKGREGPKSLQPEPDKPKAPNLFCTQPPLEEASVTWALGKDLTSSYHKRDLK